MTTIVVRNEPYRQLVVKNDHFAVAAYLAEFRRLLKNNGLDAFDFEGTVATFADLPAHTATGLIYMTNDTKRLYVSDGVGEWADGGALFGLDQASINLIFGALLDDGDDMIFGDVLA